MPTFKVMLAWPIGPGGALRASQSQRVNVYEPGSTDTPAGLTQDGQAVQWVTSDETGAAEFSTTSAHIVDLATPDGRFTRRIESQENIGSGSGGGTVVDATPTTKGIVRLAGDLGGTAASPTVPALADKVDIDDAVALAGASDLPIANGTAFQGTANIAARSDHVHPATASGTPYPLRGAGSGMFTQPIGAIVPNSSNKVANVKAPATPLPVPRAMNLAEVYLRIEGAADAGSYKVAVYAAGDDGVPTGAPVYTSPAGSATTATMVAFSTGGLVLDGPLYWLVFGSYGFTTTRALPNGKVLQGNPLAESLTPNFVASSSTNPVGLFLANFNESTGAFPTLTGVGADFVGGNISQWTYLIRGTIL